MSNNSKTKTNMDIITKSQFDQFRTLYDIEGMKESEAFELFSIYCIASSFVKSETLSKDLLLELNVGGGNDWGIDGFVAIVNGKIVNTPQAVDDLLQSNGFIAVQFVIIQSKVSESFDSAEVAQFLDGVEFILNDVLGESSLPICNDDISDVRRLVKHIYSKSADFQNGDNPKLSVFYVTCGEYQAQSDFVSKIAKTTAFVSRTDLISNNGFSCSLLGKREIIALYKAAKSQLTINIRVEQKLPMPEVESVDESYLCLLKYSEYKKLIIDADGIIIESVFNDNVRAFQGENTVNKAMSESLKSGNLSLFTAMNNGITVIAREMRTTGNNIHLMDYQVVNGCQTSYVLYANDSVPGINDLVLIVKLIASKDKEIRDKIIVGNNSQTEVKREQLVSLLDTQKYIEDYYSAQSKFEKLYYERRSKQYRNAGTQIPQDKIITISAQIKSFVSMIMGEPDKVRGYYGSIVEQYDKAGKRVFSEKTKPELYYTSALGYYKMVECFANGVINRKYKVMKYHILLAFRLMCEPFSLPEWNSRKVSEYCDHLCSTLCDKSRCERGFVAAESLVENALMRDPMERDRMSESFTKKLVLLAKQLDAINRKKKETDK